MTLNGVRTQDISAPVQAAAVTVGLRINKQDQHYESELVKTHERLCE